MGWFGGHFLVQPLPVMESCSNCLELLSHWSRVYLSFGIDSRYPWSVRVDPESLELLSIGSHISDLSPGLSFYVETVLLAFIRQCIGSNQCLDLNQALFTTYHWISRSYKTGCICITSEHSVSSYLAYRWQHFTENLIDRRTFWTGSAIQWTLLQTHFA